MSQNQSYFWHTTRHNVYLKRSARLHMWLALMAVLTFSTICMAEVDKEQFSDDTGVTMGVPTKNYMDDKQLEKISANDGPNGLPDSDATADTKLKAGFIDAFSASISVILFTELGDKTFFIAAIMAMRHPRLIVFAGAISALALMTVLSVVFGMAATIIPKIYTYYISTALFAIFGLKMIYDGYFMKDSDAHEEMEEVQASLRKHDDELLRPKRAKYEDSEAKRKNSNSDKEDGGAECGAGAVASTKTTRASIKNSEMHHRQRKQLSHNNNNNTNTNNNGCQRNNDDDSDDACNESDVFLEGEMAKMTTFHSSPALSASALSNQTDQTNCDDSPNKLNYKASNGDTPSNIGKQHKLPNERDDATAMVHSTSASGALMMNSKNGIVAGTSNSINSISSLSINSIGGVVVDAGQPNGELKQLGGSIKRRDRDASAKFIQDPESGVVRKNKQQTALYFTTRILMQAFTMTFLAEWGDRSQLTTIILAASKDVYGVIVGGILGHSICTGLAVIGGRMVAAKISVRTVTILGGIVFLGFALYALIVRPDDI